MGERALLADTAAMLARVLDLQGRVEEADEACRVAERYAALQDISAQAGWRGVRARLLATEGRAEEAQERAREAVELAARTDFLAVHAGALADLCTVLERVGREDDARAAIAQASALYGRKGDVVSVARRRSYHQRPEAHHAEVLGDQAPR